MVTIDELMNERVAVLVLKNGQIFRGTGFGKSTKVLGEVVYTTSSFTGYNELLTDSNNYQQIHNLTFPLIGNQGVPNSVNDEFGIPTWFESEQTRCSGLIVHEYCKIPSHFECVKVLEQYMVENNIPGIQGVDTRAITQMFRTEGVQIGMLQVFEPGENIPTDAQLLEMVNKMEDPNSRNLVAEISIKEPKIYSPKSPIGTVVIIDCGVKYSIIRMLCSKGLKVIRVPYNSTYEQIMAHKPNGVLISNGPGNPKKCPETIEVAKKLIAKSFPTFGIDLGHQILALAAGCETYKLRSGHRGSNKPCFDLKTKRGIITNQNHGYVVTPDSIKVSEFLPSFEHQDDHTNEGIYHPSKPIFSVQFFPADDTEFLYDNFIKNLNCVPQSKGGVK